MGEHLICSVRNTLIKRLHRYDDFPDYFENGRKYCGFHKHQYLYPIDEVCMPRRSEVQDSERTVFGRKRRIA